MIKRLGTTLLLLLVLIPLGRVEAAWPDDGSYTAWSACYKITTQASKISAVNGWYFLDLALLPSGFHTAAQTDMDDFRATSDGETAINHKLIFYDAGTDTGLVAIAQPHGSGGASADVDSYVYIGNAGASSTSTASTFPSTLESLYMLQEEPTSNTAIKDTSGNGRDSKTIDGSMTSGDLVTGGPHSGLKAIKFDGNDRINVPSTIIDASESAGAYSWMAWVKIDNDSSTRGLFASYGNQIKITFNYAADGPHVLHRNSSNTSNFTASSASDLTSWTHLAVVYNGSTLKIYKNGTELTSVTATSFMTDSADFAIGSGSGAYWVGDLADISLYSEALSADQIATWYANEKDSGFWAVEEHTPSSGMTVKERTRGFFNL